MPHLDEIDCGWEGLAAPLMRSDWAPLKVAGSVTEPGWQVSTELRRDREDLYG